MKIIPILIISVISSLSFAKQPMPEVLVNHDDVIWGFDFLKDGRIIFTERSGKVFVVDPKTKKEVPITGFPKVYAVGQGGLLDVRVHPTNGFIYFTYSEPVGEKATTAFARAKLQDNRLVEFKKLFSAHEPNKEDLHFGSRIEFDGKGHIFVTVGDRDNRERAQDLKYHQGKILRFNEDGTVPKDNPFVSTKDAKPEIWSLGHRSPQGLVMNQETQELWEAEMGPRGGDEINLIKKGANYGWPVVTFGREYYGPKIGEGNQKAGMENPVEHWVPSISPSAMTFWNKNIYLATLSGQHIHRLEMKDNKVVKQDELYKNLDWRFRNLRPGPDGKLYFSTDEGKLGRISQ
ncbi:PQQ-dependent sugar dehydrogenase [Peredibacter starrii]|uniref:PQQ-dependent sugar dehydrogenase n=1 Tax=Peredibacter starrii TaxID=28202 RepID=A0AAX4HR92_9BACT|nr:PQQ-dependent sugar dehydrogenase [Peredibacter starrii]WPU65869.1 PQQ-dependent sugar dehydrogenase [Peredibacter starrii]